MTGIGYHYLYDFYECEKHILNDIPRLGKMMVESSLASGARIISEHSHKFEPYGVSSIIILAESHLSLHTWPEYDFASVDLFSCNSEIDGTKAMDVLVKYLLPKNTVMQKILRGLNIIKSPLVP